MLSNQVQMPNVNNKNWTPYKKLWRKLKMIRELWKVEADPDRKNYLKEWEIEISRKIVSIAKTLTDGKGKPIPIPMFPVLGSNQ